MRIHPIKTGNVIVKSAFLGSPATAGGTLPYLANVFLGHSRVPLPIMAWAIEHSEGVIVVDTGEQAASKGNFITQSRYDISPDEEVGAQLKRLGISPKDVSKVILTHLHGDHIDGLKDFPGVPVWVSQREYSPFQNSNGGFFSKLGIQLPEGFSPNLISFQPEKVGSFEYSYPLTRDGSVIAVPTPGHTAGHLSVIVRDGDTHYFIAGDVSYYERAVQTQSLEGPTMEIALHRDTLRRVSSYIQQVPTVYLPSHDPESPRRLVEKQATIIERPQTA